jgi:NTP pyrophosphatase (non-canonical NTP hydrolase)
MHDLMDMVMYKELALRTIKPHTNKDMAIVDWALGLGGEVGEVFTLIREESKDKMEIAKELGDVLWYAVALADEINIRYPIGMFSACQDFYSDRTHCPTCRVDDQPINTTIDQLIMTITGIQEAIKHIVVHKEDVSFQTIEGKLHAVIERLTYLAILHGFSIYDVAELNAAKLAHRYNAKNGGLYTVGASANRHASEVAFEDTATYKRLYSRITEKTVIITPEDVEVL